MEEEKEQLKKRIDRMQKKVLPKDPFTLFKPFVTYYTIIITQF